METSLNNELKNDLKSGAKNTRHLPAKEKTAQQKHWQNLINKILNDYFGVLVFMVVLVVLITSYYLLILPKYQKIVETINATFYEGNKLAPKYKELSDYQALAEAYKKVDPEDVKKVKNLVPAEYLKEDLFTEIIYLASVQGLSVDTLSVVKDGEASSTALTSGKGRVSGADAGGPATTGISASDVKLPGGVGSFNIKIVLSKINYPTLKSWLQTVENSLRIIDIKSLSFDPKTSSASLEMTTYYLKK